MRVAREVDKAVISSRRDQLLETATTLFYRNGCHTTGIDRVLAEAGVAKMTLYKHFRSKDELVLAAAQRFHDQIRETFEGYVEANDLSPSQRLLAVFDFMAEWCERPDFCGCPAINLAVQYPDPDDPIHQSAAEHKRIREFYIRDIAERAGAKDPASLARNVLILLEGATVLRQVTGSSAFIQNARRAAQVLIEQQIAQE